MDQLFSTVAAAAAAHHGVVSAAELVHLGVCRSRRDRWIARGMLVRVGQRAFVVGGAPSTWHRLLAVAQIEVEGCGWFAGRTAARLHGLDGFIGASAVEVLAPRGRRKIVAPAIIRSTELSLGRGDTVVVDGFRCLTAQRLILDSPLFGFSQAETENAIDAAIRLRKVSEQRLRTAVVARHRRGINGGRTLLDAMVDTGGESRLERWVLTLVRRAGLPRPTLRKVHRDGTRIVARVDLQFGTDLVVEIAGHGTHSSRRQRQIDEQRRTELTLRGLRVITFTYDDVRERPDWLIAQLRLALRLTAQAA